MPLIQSDNVLVGDEIEFSLAETSIGELAVATLSMNADKVLQIDVETGEELTGALLLNRAVKIADYLLQCGIKPGDSVTINSENRLEYIVVPLACFFVGATFAPLNPEYTKGELVHVVSLSCPKIAFCSLATFKVMVDLCAEVKYIKRLILFGDKRVDGAVMYQDLIRDVGPLPLQEDYEPVPIDPQTNVATILCSSGTTGLPKGVMTTHLNMTAFIEIARARIQEMIDLGEGSSSITTFGIAPFFHSMGFMSMFMNCLGGNLLIVMSNFKTKLFFEAIQKYKVNTLIVPPPIILVLLKHPASKNYDLSSLKMVRSGAAPMGKDIEMELKAKFRLGHVSQSYGLTETTLGVLLSPFDDTRPGSVGQLVPGMMCKIVNENGDAMGPNQEGEICFKGPLIMKGYVNNVQATNDTIDKDGWLHTGDVAYFDKDGFFYIVDRIKELIKYKGYQVAPAELEAILQTHPGVNDVAVIGLPDERAGELPLAFIVKKPGAAVTEKEIQEFVAGKVSRQKRLTGGVRFIEEIPKNPSGKILRRVLKQQAISYKSKL